MSRSRSVSLALGVVLAVTAAACDGGGSAAPTSTVPAEPTTTVGRPDDGILRIGVLLPRSGAASEFGRPLTAAVDLAVRQINDAGGVLGQAVEVALRDEGATTAVALQAARELIDEGVDAIIGPASSNVALGVLEHVVSAGVPVCSPTATSLALDGFVDDGLFFRTIPSDSLLAAAIADELEQTGRPSVAIVFLDDPYGRPFATRLRTEAEARNLSVVASVGYSPGDGIAAAADQALSPGPDVVALIGDRQSGADVVAAIASSPRGDDVRVVVNDTLRAPMPQTVRDSIPRSALGDIAGVAPTARALNDDFVTAMGSADGPYALNAYDCANLLALASAQAFSDSPAEIAAQMAATSSGGSACTTFVECSTLLAEGRNIDYNGPDGTVELTAGGELSRGRFDVFSFDSSGLDRLADSLTVSRAG